MTVASLVAVVAPCTGKIIKKYLCVFEEEKIVYYTLCLRQSSEKSSWKVRIYADGILTFLKGLDTERVKYDPDLIGFSKTRVISFQKLIFYKRFIIICYFQASYYYCKRKINIFISVNINIFNIKYIYIYYDKNFIEK